MSAKNQEFIDIMPNESGSEDNDSQTANLDSQTAKNSSQTAKQSGHEPQNNPNSKGESKTNVNKGKKRAKHEKSTKSKKAKKPQRFNFSTSSSSSDSSSGSISSSSSDSESDSDSEYERKRVKRSKKAYAQFDPLEEEEDFQLPSNLAEFLAKYFETFLDEEAMAKVLEDCPFPNCEALQVPKLDDDWVDLLEDDKRNFPLIKADKNRAL